ncbi:MAG: hypothetical protein WKF65_15185 [Gaiellaceae bacterium]
MFGNDAGSESAFAVSCLQLNVKSRARCGLPLFTLTGVLFFGHWLLADPSFEVTEAITDTKYVLLFSAALLILAFALAVFGRMVGGRWVLRLSLLAGAGAALGSIANVVEDGLDMGWAFWGLS